MNCIEIEFLEEMVKSFDSKNLPSDFVLKILAKVKIILKQYQTREYNYKDVVKKQCELNLSMANIESTNEINLDPKKKFNALKILVDNAEYRTIEIAEISGRSLKYIKNIFSEKNIPIFKRDDKGAIYLGSDIKKYLL